MAAGCPGTEAGEEEADRHSRASKKDARAEERARTWPGMAVPGR